jgi:hypothetical protein
MLFTLQRWPLGLLIAGYMSAVAGVALLSMPAALIAGGLALIALAIHEVYGK